MSILSANSLPTPLLKLCQHLNDAGGKAWLVGGCVRDLILAIQPKDFDLEVYGLQATKLQNLLRQLGRTEHVGQAFGVFKLRLDGLEFDVALPRSEIKLGIGHRAFDVTPAPFISISKAAIRRDFTINAMMFDPLHDIFIDDHGGRHDLKHKILKHVSPAFAEDPLRVMRAMQFAARFQLTLHPDTAVLCHALLSEADALPEERIWVEWQKWSHAPYPSYGLRALRDSGWLHCYPALKDLMDCPQSPYWHPEGDVWIHTLQVCDQAACIAKRQDLDQTTTEQLVFAALCHDLGKPATTSISAAGNISSPNHSEAGIAPTIVLLDNIGAPKRLAAYITPMIFDHITHLHGEPTSRAIRRLAHRLEPANIELWEMLAEADASGRAPIPASRPALPWLQKAIQLRHHQKKPQPILNGKILMSLGVTPGPDMGKVLKKAYEAQLDGQFENEKHAILWLQHRLKHNRTKMSTSQRPEINTQ